ncbi:uncharacterized protein EV420DRAFT_1481689 [Desarmillaria tabescens]|uniref:F-box domain-containing protein n=1 Tax=Armillaria tabescens TaxID=1929756 RepID=A0AA39K4A4_ARMTA|nr:uncharacterized protein EV420DRAFT_1481689 [Desarmillaria tabescens]KAK0454255.1 hypothetical protein EV420DRAFT_1481689 [Desarmillaria tabescens]
MASRSSPKGRSHFEELPAELILEVILHLRVASIKQLSLVSSTFRHICFPSIFRDVSFTSRRTPRRFLSTTRSWCAVPCVRKLSFDEIDSKAVKPHELLPWCTLVQELKMCLMADPTLYVPLLSGLGELRVFKLEHVIFQCSADLLEVFRSMSSTVKDLRIDDVQFASISYDEPIPTHTGKRIQVEKLSVGSSLVLELLLRDDSPVGFSHLEVAETRTIRSHLINKLCRLSPRLTKLVIGNPILEFNNEPLELSTVKRLILFFYYLEPGLTPLRDLLKPSNTHLEELTIKLPVVFVTGESSEWESLALALSRRPRLKRVNVVLWEKWHRAYADVNVRLNELHRRLEPRRHMISRILANNHFQVTVEGAHWFGDYSILSTMDSGN